jgi:inner membrane protein
VDSMSDSLNHFADSFRRSKMLQLLALGFIVLVLEIPISMIAGLVWERQQRRQEAVDEVSAKWGKVQSITGPALVVPYTHRWTEVSAAGRRIDRSETRHAVFLPRTLRVRGTLDTETRHRGIFSIPVYRLKLEFEGEFGRPKLQDLGITPAAVAWDRAQLAIGVSDARAIQEETRVSWGDRQIPFLPATGAFADAGTGIHAEVGVDEAADQFAFSFPLLLNGSLGVYLTPFAQSTDVDLRADYGHPSFQGTWLPDEYSVSDSAFEASWSIPFLGRNYPQAWKVGEPMGEAIDGSRFGVELVNPVDQYRMAERSVKYASLFILLTFGSVWLVEILAGIRVHPIQYFMLGGALCLFYLLELSLSEHLGFLLAYAIASLAVIGLISAYGAVALRSARRAAVIGTGVALLYAYLYILLTNEDYALLIGSIGLFFMLAAIMYVTRRVNWYEVGPGAGRDSRMPEEGVRP